MACFLSSSCLACFFLFLLCSLLPCLLLLLKSFPLGFFFQCSGSFLLSQGFPLCLLFQGFLSHFFRQSLLPSFLLHLFLLCFFLEIVLLQDILLNLLGFIISSKEFLFLLL